MKFSSRQRFLLLISLLASIAALLLHRTPSLQLLDAKLFDAFARIRGVEAPKSPIVILAVDDASIRIMNQKWQWERNIFATALRHLKKDNPRMVLLDFIFSEPGTTKEDRALDDALQKMTPIPVASGISLAQHISREKRPENTAYIIIEKSIHQPFFPSLIPGFLNIENDDDATIRRTSLKRVFEGNTYYALAMQGLKALAPKDYEARLEWLDNQSDPEMLLNYRGPDRTFPRISFYQLYNGLLPENYFKDKIVLIGPTFDDSQDFYFTPFFEYKGIKSKMAGVEIHANILDNLLNNSDWKKGPFSLELIIFLILGLCAALFFSGWLSTRLAFLYSGGLGLVYFALTYLCLSQGNLLLPGLLPLFLLFGLTLVFSRLNIFWKQRDLGEEMKHIKSAENYQLENFCERYEISKREKEVLVLIIQDFTNSEITRKLFISLSTVKSHITSIYRKANLKNRDELIELIKKTF